MIKKKIEIFILLLIMAFLSSCKSDIDIDDGGIINNSNNQAPKSIISKDIEYLSTHFNIDNHTYDIEIINDNNSIILSETSEFNIKEVICKEDLQRFQRIIDNYNLVNKNGYDVVSVGLPDEYSPMYIDIKYQSGETLHYKDDGNPYCLWTKSILRLLKRLFIEKGHNDLIPSFKTIKDYLFNFKYDNKAYSYYLDLENNQIVRKIDDNGNLEIIYSNIQDDYLKELFNLIYQLGIEDLDDGTSKDDINTCFSDYYEINISFIDGHNISSYTNDINKLKEFNEIKEELMFFLNSYFIN